MDRDPIQGHVDERAPGRGYLVAVAYINVVANGGCIIAAMLTAFAVERVQQTDNRLDVICQTRT